MTEVRAASSSSEIDEALELRRRVFVDEQRVTIDADRDGRDREAIHVVALEGGRIVGTCRLVFDDDLARLGRMAVERDARGQGIGGAMLAEAETAARAAGATRIRLHAQTASRSLYERGGFETRGEEFIEEGIPHVTMEKRLA
ncbi:MAG TPA: GNAT family N-acetyltransferase [Thermoleophilaceae bacterium]